MIVEIDSLKERSLETDICIVGAGAAGIVLAVELSRAGKNVTLLEGGGRNYSETVQNLYALDTTGLPIKHDSRIRVFGGTTTVWTGGWKLFDKFDFERKEWLPLSGWPVGFEELLPYHERAAAMCGGPALETLYPDYFKTEASAPLSTEQLQSTVLGIMPANRIDFGKSFQEELETSPRIRVLLGANVRQIVKGTKKNQISHLTVKTLSGNEYRISGKTFVIACGGIENARLLLASDIANEHDQVGRYYMDHPKKTLGTIRRASGGTDISANIGWKEKNGTYIIGLELTEAYQKKHKVLNSYVQLHPSMGDSFLSKSAGRIMRTFGKPAPYISLRNFMEQAPEPANRVTLSEQRDALGNPLAKISWNISELDKKSLMALHTAISEECSRLGIGSLESPLLQNPEESLKHWPVTNGASHHMGTTRMGTDPKTSVVTPECAVHGIDNLFIAGSSVFPTSGNANPTGTILALALRLADHIQDK
jgi:choline dehydrogenase-like flavoprotein